LDFLNPNSLEGEWAAKANGRKIGLCFAHSKVINIPLNIVTHSVNNRNMNFLSKEELLNKFEEGYKIDISPLEKINNESAHYEYQPQFILR
jgi:hypothetical protein